mmetsp:Transcript_16982/g.30427  ORF Transcript_16982/g.30427 Transcript_16982/m.30427 type:complete len:127 (+) Transcript_16982:2-382(+)
METNQESKLGAETKDPQFVLLVNLKFASVEDRQTFEKKLVPLVEYVGKNEQYALSYCMLRDEKDETKLTIFERYETQAKMSGHSSSPLFQKLIRPGAEAYKALSAPPVKSYQKLFFHGGINGYFSK